MIDVSRHFGQPLARVHLNPSLIAFSKLEKIQKTINKQKVDKWELSLVISGNAPMKLTYATEQLARDFMSHYID
jgi:hypothetical protein